MRAIRTRPVDSERLTEERSVDLLKSETHFVKVWLNWKDGNPYQRGWHDNREIDVARDP